MTANSKPITGRHIDTSRPVDWLAKHLRPARFLEWSVVIALALLLWPSTIGGRFGLVMVAGNSMEPTYQLGDAVISWRKPAEVGDIVLYKIPDGHPAAGKTVIHRVIGTNSDGWVTQGDNSANPDPWYPSGSDVLGVAVTKIPLGGEILVIVRSWWFIAGLGAAAIALFLWPDSEDERASKERARRGRHLAPT